MAECLSRSTHDSLSLSFSLSFFISFFLSLSLSLFPFDWPKAFIKHASLIFVGNCCFSFRFYFFPLSFFSSFVFFFFYPFLLLSIRFRLTLRRAGLLHIRFYRPIYILLLLGDFQTCNVQIEQQQRVPSFDSYRPNMETECPD